MKVAITAVGPMLPCAIGASAAETFSLAQLQAAPRTDWFDPQRELGGRGFKYFGQATRYLLAGLRHVDPVLTEGWNANHAVQKGIIVGSNSCARRILDEIDDLLVRDGYTAIDPMRAADFCSNMGTAAASIKHRAKAFNLTLLTPMTAGMDAVILAQKAILAGRSRCAIAAGVEDGTQFTLGPGTAMQTIGGALALRLELRESGVAPTEGERPALAWLDASYQGFVPVLANGRRSAVLRHLEERLAPLAVGRPRVAIAALGDPASRFTTELVQEALTRHGVGWSDKVQSDGDSGYATLLSLAQIWWMARHADQAMCISISPLGHVSALRLSANQAGDVHGQTN